MADSHSLLGLLLGFCAALTVSTLTTPLGVSGAVFLLPVQVSLLGVPSPTVTPTNLIYNIAATPGGLLRYVRQGQLDGPLARLLLAGTIPGVMVGAWIRVDLLPGEAVFRLLLAVVLGAVGSWLLVAKARPERHRDSRPPAALLIGIAAAVGVVGGIVGIGGGAILAPMLVGLGYTLARAAPVALLSTLVTCVFGVATYVILARIGHTTAGPDWLLGIVLGAGGLCGGYLGARLQPHVRDAVLRRTLGVVAVLVALVYLAQSVA